MRYTVSYCYTNAHGSRIAITDYFRDKANAIEHAKYIRQRFHVIAIISNN